MCARASVSATAVASEQPPNAMNCMNSRVSDRCGSPFFIPPFSLRSGGSGPRRASVGFAIAFWSIIPHRDRRLLPASARRLSTTLPQLARHRVSMFVIMGVSLDAETLDVNFRAWLAETMAAGSYRAWLVETAEGTVVAGGGITIILWPPGPRYPGSRLAFVVQRLHRAATPAARTGAAGDGCDSCLVPRRRHPVAGAERQQRGSTALRGPGLRRHAESDDVLPPRAIARFQNHVARAFQARLHATLKGSRHV